MRAKENDQFSVEPERYELHSGPAFHFELDRREFFQAMGGGVFVLMLLDGVFAQESGGGRRRGSERIPQELSAWLHIAEDGRITVYTGKVEVGQDIRTSLTQVVAEELHLPLTSISLIMGDTDLTPFDMGTFGSQTTPMMARQLRRAAATAREALIDLANEQWKTDRATLTVSDGKITNPATKKSVDFGRLTKGQKLMKAVNETAPTTPASSWKVAGTSPRQIGGRAKVTGSHKYTPDIKRPGMIYGKVVRPSAFNATLTSADTKAAEAMPGITLVRDGDFIAVAAASERAASLAARAINAEWKAPPQLSTAELFDYLKKKPAEGQGPQSRPSNAVGSIEQGLSEAQVKLEQTYTVAYIAHVPLEPRAAVAEWNDGKLTVWTGTQRPFGVRSELAEAFRVPETQVRVIMPDTGSGYGGKHTGEAAIEAARIAKAAGKPVKLVWTREEEFTWAYFRPAGVIDVKSGVSADGKITAWEFHNYNSGGSGIRTLYDIPNQKIEFHPVRSPLKQGSYRALAATANHFARESHMDELANALKMDALEFRLKNLKDARLRAVLEAAASRFGWAKTKPAAGFGFGIAGGFEKGAYVASCAEVAADRSSGAVRIVRVVTAFECGAVINPDNLKNQIEGSIVQGIGGALFEAIDFANGKILNPRLSRYRVPRFSDVPAMETVLVDRKDLPSTGAGETPIVCLAPAVGNAIFAASGVRHRSLPMVPSGLKAAGV
jgi:isoquinoline 1-oxidoreductase